MKTLNLFLIFSCLTFSCFSQSVNTFKYQAVVRDSTGNVISDQNVSIKISILENSISGNVIYCEIHGLITNSFGIINLEVGRGNLVSGSFDDIVWGLKEHYLKTEVDFSGGSNYLHLGTSQLLAVPYANHSVTSERMPSMTAAERDSLQSPGIGMQIYNSTTNCINYYSGISWYETCGDCTPVPSVANAGPDQYYTDTTTVVTLGGNTPEYGTGTWTVISGTGGSFDNINDPNTLFYGQHCTMYTLKWTISNPCASTADSVNILFFSTPGIANAGPDQYNITGNFTILEANTPDNGLGMWQILSGTGGILVSSTNPNTYFFGQTGELYELKWTISTQCASSFDTVHIDFGTSFICGVTPLIDIRDGQTYTTVQIGSQCWMAENLNIGTMINSVGNQANNGTIEKYCYGNNTANCDEYGGLYQWDEMMAYSATQGVQGICPDGWHLPTDVEWCTLEQFVDPTITCSSTGWRGVDGGGKLKEAGTTHWQAPNTGATNSSGFTAFPGGHRDTNGYFGNLTDHGYWWSSSEGGSNAWRRDLTYDNAQVYRTSYSKNCGYSVRCIRD